MKPLPHSLRLTGELEIMPPSILKYVDIARMLGAGVKCPACNSLRCQPSRWHSKHEKLGAQGFRPYHCDDCTNRFLAASNAARERVMINAAAGILLSFGALTAADLWFESYDDPKIRPAAPVTVFRSEPSTAVTKAEARMGVAAPEATKDPVELGKTLKNAASDGDVAAMLQLGRALASGDKLPTDVDEAAKWIHLAAATGSAEGMFELARFYRDGLGLPQDPVRAYIWFSRATAAKHPTAMHERDALVRTMSDEKLKEAHQLSSLAEPLADTEVQK